jgi:uncharacterized protein YidB (DUF937 family)
MDLMKMAVQLFTDKLGGKGAGLNEDVVGQALSGLLGDGAGNIDLGSIMSKLDGGGLATLAQSWLGDGANSSISPQQIMSLFGDSAIGDFASKLNLDPSTASNGLSKMLPELIDSNSKGGGLLDSVLGDSGGLLGSVGGFLK